MSRTVHAVRHVRVAAGDALAVHSLQPRPEDALRCASRFHAGCVLVLFKFVLGSAPRQTTSQPLSFLIERRPAWARRRGHAQFVR